MLVSRFLTLTLLAVIGFHAHAGMIVNGDFSDPIPLAGFVATGSDVGEPIGEFAQLDIGGGSSRALNQTFDIASGATSLSFDFAFSTTATIATAPLLPDSFSASVVTTTDGETLDVLVVDLFGAIPDPSEGFEAFFGVELIDVAIDPSVTIPGYIGLGATEFSGRVTFSLPPQVRDEEATITFRLLDNDIAAHLSRAAVDNITVESGTGVVPEPTSIAAWGAILCSGLLIRRRRDRVSR